ncbi:hypothetical protein [Exercitatus varius]|uniref:hypothetical protein n=1 Tax=Exercitatus varius TaxID=67857 RepID=UPI00294B84DB|nr:hypothetical protein [Exercitatus varius]MDG2957410.1 hypothetical protein [Exercitatus varius]
MSFVDELIGKEFTYEPYDGFCPDFSEFFDKLKFPDNYASLNPKPSPPIKGSSWYSPSYEYVVVWYESSLVFHRKNTQAHVKIKLVNLNNPTYEKGDSIRLSTLFITVPIDILHYFFIGSVWKSGKAIKQVKFNEYLVTANQEFEGKRDNVSYSSFFDKEKHKYNKPFSPNLYTIESDCNNYIYDENQLIKIQQNDKDFIIHPLHLFSSHYGLSASIKRILVTYNWDEVTHRFHLNENEPSIFPAKHVLLPKYFVKKDSIFLYHLKYSEVTKLRTKILNNEIKFSHENQKPIKVPFWHDQEVQLKLRGIELENTILCAEIIGINQPVGDDITLVLHRNKKVDKENSQSNENEKVITKTYRREVNTEYLGTKITDSEPDNRTSQSIKRRFEELGQKRIINTVNVQHQNNNPTQTKVIPPNEASELGFGDHYGSEGKVGLAACFLDDTSESKDLKLFKLWDMAQEFALFNNGKAHWFTPNLGFRNDDDLVFLSLEHDTAFAYPEIALVIRIILDDEKFYIIDFSQKSHDISMSGIAYKENNNEDFISLDNTQSSKLMEIICEVILSEQLPTEYISQQNEKEMKIATFKHPTAESSNWVYNGISKLTKRILMK